MRWVSAAIGLRVVAHETLKLTGAALTALMLIAGATFIALGARAVAAVVL